MSSSGKTDDVQLAAAERGGASNETPTQAQLEAMRHRAAQLKAKVHKLRKDNAKLRDELTSVRASLRDPLPDLHLPSNVDDVVNAVVEERLTFLRREDLLVLARQVLQVEQVQREGIIVEAGAALGGSAIVLAAAKAPARKMKVYDVFGMIPEPSERDGVDVHKRYEKIASGEARGLGGKTYYGYRENLYAEVRESFTRHGVGVEQNAVDLVQGLFEDTILLDEPVAFAHLDGDWYDSTMVCLERISPLLVPGGRIILDDYFHYSGCRRAVDDYFEGRTGYRMERRAKLHVVRLSS